eukprot:2958771-Rhodomonas_salina.4
MEGLGAEGPGREGEEGESPAKGSPRGKKGELQVRVGSAASAKPFVTELNHLESPRSAREVRVSSVRVSLCPESGSQCSLSMLIFLARFPLPWDPVSSFVPLCLCRSLQRPFLSLSSVCPSIKHHDVPSKMFHDDDDDDDDENVPRRSGCDASAQGPMQRVPASHACVSPMGVSAHLDPARISI